MVFTTQAMGIIPIDNQNNILCNNITWVDGRAEKQVKKLMNRFLGRKVFKSTGLKVTEWSGACSYAFNLKKKDWECIFFKLAGINTSKLPPLVRSVDNVGGLTKEAAATLELEPGLPVFGG
jgi:xylulokinase